MLLGRRTARRQAVFLLYQQDLLKLSSEAALRRRGGTTVDEYAARLIAGVTGQLSAIDEVLQEHLSGWNVARLGILERAILRVAAHELLFEPDVPDAVAIDEAVALAKRFCSDEAGALVNGVLGSVVASRGSRQTEDEAAPQQEGGES
jgi:transcription antitermination protein NusB